MKFFLDANVLISVLNKEYPAYIYTSRILSMAGAKNTTLVTSALTLAITYYFAEKKHGQDLANEKIKLLVAHLEIANCGNKEAAATVKNKKVHDFEDGLQYYSAVHAGCSCIVTDNLSDFYFSDLQVFEPERFFRKYSGSML